MDKLILIKYGELTTKKQNRNMFINILYQNIKSALSKYNVRIIKNRVRMFIMLDEEDIDEVSYKLQNIFGIHSIVICDKVNNNIEDIRNGVIKSISSISFNTFKVETNRSDKSFPLTSMEVSKLIGRYVLESNSSYMVDVHNPDYVIKIEIREDAAYIYNKEIPGISGYPVSVQGRGLLMLSGGIDSPVSLYLAMKRGIKVECIYFESPPHTSLQAKNKVIKLAKILTRYTSSITVHVVNFTSLQEAIYKNGDSSYMITIMRRMMYRISEIIAKKNKCHCIINGESIGQVASQTLTSMEVINSVSNFPVIRPVCCMDKLEIIDIAKKIGTYDVSILPYEDCCTIFLPAHPVINPKLDVCLKIESNFDYESLISECVNSIETIVVEED